MNPIIIEISSYLISAISLGYLFGWLITRAMLKSSFRQQVQAFKEKYHYAAEGIDELQEELAQSKSRKSDLESKNNKILLESNSRKLQLHEIGIKYKELKKLNINQTSTIEKLNFQLSDKENELIRLQKEHIAQIKDLLYQQNSKSEKEQEY
jgi:chromosome segregation ATPase